jgi:hypothetical protein
MCNLVSLTLQLPNYKTACNFVCLEGVQVSRSVFARAQGTTSVEVLRYVLDSRLCENKLAAWMKLLPFFPVNYKVLKETYVCLWVGCHDFVLIDANFFNFLEWFQFSCARCYFDL